MRQLQPGAEPHPADPSVDPVGTLADLAADRSPDGLRPVLRGALDRMGMDAVYLSEFRGDRVVFVAVAGDAASFGLASGHQMARADSYCQRLVDGRISNVVRDARVDLRVMDLDVTAGGDVGSYVGVPVVLSNGHASGTLSCLNHAPDPEVDHADVQYLRVLARLAADEVECRRLRGQRKRLEVQRIQRILQEGSLRMVFQPIVSLEGGAIVGMEALARFGTEPDRSPEAWFAEAETAGLRMELELLAVGAALAQLESLPEDAYLSVNVSAETVSSPRFLALLDDTLGGRVVIEITEHTPIRDYSALKSALRALRLRGARLAIDDTGAGLSSLAHIHRLLPDIVKLDVSLTHDIDRDPVRQSLAASLISFASEIGATIVAEGIETPAEEETLRALGVDSGQGWFLGRPGAMSDGPGALHLRH